MIGFDIESIKRIEFLVENKPTIVKKFFSKHEWEYANKKAKIAETLTGLWCAKEAVVKALSNRKSIQIKDVEIRHHLNGGPFVYSICNQKFDLEYSIEISISHTREYATAMALVRFQ